jgi:hypothetical protein
MVSAEKADTVEWRWADLRSAKVRQGQIRLVKRRDDGSSWESLKHGQDDAFCASALREVVVNDDRLRHASSIGRARCHLYVLGSPQVLMYPLMTVMGWSPLVQIDAREEAHHDARVLDVIDAPPRQRGHALEYRTSPGRPVMPPEPPKPRIGTSANSVGRLRPNRNFWHKASEPSTGPVGATGSRRVLRRRPAGASAPPVTDCGLVAGEDIVKGLGHTTFAERYDNKTERGRRDDEEGAR